MVQAVSPFSLPINSETVRKLGRSLTFSCDKIRNLLGYEPAETLETGIAKEVMWLKKGETPCH
jgi:nucleoside-diphosphate-sugar epimerase